MLSSKPAADPAALSAGGFLHVVAGAVIGPDGRVLIAQRPAGKHLAGGWEFPGGKLDPGEDRQAGLARELREEIGIQVHSGRPLIRLRHRYAERGVLLDVWLVEHFSGSPRALDGQALRWCARDELLKADLLAADRAVVAALRLPPVIDSAAGLNYELMHFDAFNARSSPSRADSSGFMRGLRCASAAQARAAQDAGADFIVLDELLGADDLAQLCDQVNLPVFAAGMDLDTAWRCGATGISR